MNRLATLGSIFFKEISNMTFKSVVRVFFVAFYFVSPPSFSQMIAEDKKILTEFFVGKDGSRFWSSTGCSVSNVPTLKYEFDKDKPFVLHLERLSYKGAPTENNSNLLSSGYTTIRKLSSNSKTIVISSDIFMARAGSSRVERTSGTSRLFFKENPARLEVIDYFVGDKQILKGGLWVDGPDAGKKPSPMLSCN